MSAKQIVVMTGSAAQHPTPGLYPPRATVSAEAVAEAIKTAQDGSSIRLQEGDLLTRPDLPGWLGELRGRGFRAIAVETSGWVFAKPGVAKHLKKQGLTHALIPLLGSSAAAHDWLTETSGAFARSLRGVRQARAEGLRVRVIAPILRPTFRNLPDLVRRSLAIGVSGFEFRLPSDADRPAHGYHPHPALAAPHVIEALRLARAADRSATVTGVPLCLLDDSVKFATELQAPDVVIAGGEAPLSPRVLGDPCADCAARDRCGGLYESIATPRAWAGITPLG